MVRVTFFCDLKIFLSSLVQNVSRKSELFKPPKFFFVARVISSCLSYLHDHDNVSFK